MEYRVEITDVALAEAEEAYVWMIEQLSQETAENWFDGLMELIESLNKSPKRCSREHVSFANNFLATNN